MSSRLLLPEHTLVLAKDLPAWVRPHPHPAGQTSLFYTRPGVAKVVQAIFAIDASGAVFLDRSTHTPLERVDLREDAIVGFPGCVLIAAGVEQIRKVREQ